MTLRAKLSKAVVRNLINAGASFVVPRRPDGSVGLSVSARLPLPPSANNLFLTCVRSEKARLRKGKRKAKSWRIKSPEYEKWLAVAVPILSLMPFPVRTPFAAKITVYGGDGWNPRRDVANLEKPVIDAAVKAGVIKNDSVSDGLWQTTVTYIPVDTHGRVAYAVLQFSSIDVGTWPRG